MPHRPRSHELETLSRNRLHNAFTELGWIVEDLHHDYGEDLLVRLFTRGKATPYSFFIQAKATDNINKYLRANKKFLGFPVDFEHLQHWRNFSEPVILTVWDSQTDITYWEIVQKFLDEKAIIDPSLSRKQIKIEIPTTNVINAENVKRIADYTKERFNRLKEEENKSQTIIEYIESRDDVKIYYDPQNKYLLIAKNPYKENGLVLEGRMSLTTFNHFRSLERKDGIPTEESWHKMEVRAVATLLDRWGVLKEWGINLGDILKDL